MVAVIVEATGGGRGSTNSSLTECLALVGRTADVLVIGRLTDRGVATLASGLINIVNESKQAPNTLLLPGVLIDRYTKSPYRIMKLAPEVAVELQER
jgi:hypothetical protein